MKSSFAQKVNHMLTLTKTLIHLPDGYELVINLKIMNPELLMSLNNIMNPCDLSELEK